MATFVHIAPAPAATAIRRSGLKASTNRRLGRRGVFVFPRLPDYLSTHQWVRELKRWNNSHTQVAVDVRLPDDEPVAVGHYGRPPTILDAAEAVGLIAGLDDPRGHQVFVPRAVPRREVVGIRPIPQGIGWRYFPAAHGRRPCICPVCIPVGGPYTRRLIDRSN